MGTFINSPITLGDNNTISIHSQGDNIQWDEIKKDCMSLMQKLPEDSKEHAAAEEMFAASVQKDKGRFKSVVKKYAKALVSSLFVQAASTALMDVIKGIISI